MNYADARAKIKTGDMLLWRASDAGGVQSLIEHWLIRHGTASPYTHVGVALVEHGRVQVMDLTTKGCAPRWLSDNLPCDWSPAPRPLTKAAITYAFSCFGVWIYSRWQAIKGAFKRLVLGSDEEGQCAEYAISVWQESGMSPSLIATPAACAAGALDVWGSSISTLTKVE